MRLLFFRYTRNLPFTSRCLIIKSRICQLVVTVSLCRNNVPWSVGAIKIFSILFYPWNNFTFFLFQLMSHRDEVLFFQEIKFRNKLVEYLSDWVAHASNEETDLPYEITVNSRYIRLIWLNNWMWSGLT